MVRVSLRQAKADSIASRAPSLPASQLPETRTVAMAGGQPGNPTLVHHRQPPDLSVLSQYSDFPLKDRHLVDCPKQSFEDSLRPHKLFLPVEADGDRLRTPILFCRNISPTRQRQGRKPTAFLYFLVDRSPTDYKELYTWSPELIIGRLLPGNKSAALRGIGSTREMAWSHSDMVSFLLCDKFSRRTRSCSFRAQSVK